MRADYQLNAGKTRTHAMRASNQKSQHEIAVPWSEWQILKQYYVWWTLDSSNIRMVKEKLVLLIFEVVQVILFYHR